jgi:hypothetical protein
MSIIQLFAKEIYLVIVFSLKVSDFAHVQYLTRLSKKKPFDKLSEHVLFIRRSHWLTSSLYMKGCVYLRKLCGKIIFIGSTINKSPITKKSQ